MDAALSKIRPHTSSSLPHQKAPANLLVALEATFKEQNAERTPTAYFAGLITALESSVRNEAGKYSLGDGDILPAELYLLALVAPFVPAPVIRNNLNTLILFTSPLWPALQSHPPPLRSQLSLYNALLRALDKSHLEVLSVRQSFATILQLCVDSRPKVRKRAADLVHDVLASPPTPLMRHPYSEKTGEWVVNALSDINVFGSSKQKGKKGSEDAIGAAIHLLAFLRLVLQYLPSSVSSFILIFHLNANALMQCLSAITTSLLTLPRLGNPYLSQSVYSVLSVLLSSPEDPSSPRNVDVSTADLLKAVLSSPPLKTDNTLLPSWIHIIGKIMLVLKTADSEVCTTELPKVWKLVFAFLESSDTSTKREATETLVSLTECLTPQLMQSALHDNDSKSIIMQMINQLTKALDSLAFVRAIPELFFVISSLATVMRHRPSGRGTPTVTEKLLTPMIQKIAEMRVKKSFEYKEAADGVLRTAMAVIGPQGVLQALPLNLEPEDR